MPRVTAVQDSAAAKDYALVRGAHALCELPGHPGPKYSSDDDGQVVIAAGEGVLPPAGHCTPEICEGDLSQVLPSTVPNRPHMYTLSLKNSTHNPFLSFLH